MTSATASATSAATRPRRIRLRPAPAVVLVPPSFSASDVASGARCSSGARPNTAPVASPIDEREREDAEVERDIRRARQALRIRRNQRAHAGDRDAKAERRAGERQQAPFDHELTQQPPASGAERACGRRTPCGATRRARAAGWRGSRRRSAARRRPRPAARTPRSARCRQSASAADRAAADGSSCPACAARWSAVAARAIVEGQPASSVSSSACALCSVAPSARRPIR